MLYYPGFHIELQYNPMGFQFGDNVFYGIPEVRTLDSIRKSLSNPDSTGPNNLYCIVMDVGLKADFKDLIQRNLLYGVVTYAKGQIGDEPVRSQGHIHAISASCGASTCEVYEIWEGEAIIYMQEKGEDDCGVCYAVYAKEGEVVIVPPGWVHATVNADTTKPMTFGAWCVRDYGFDYTAVREHHGIAYFPKISGNGIDWKWNSNYKSGELVIKSARSYEDFGLQKGVPIYSQYTQNNNLFDFIPRPELMEDQWKNYIP